MNVPDRTVVQRRLLQVAGTFAAFVIFNRLGSLFVVGDGVSVFYPATAVDVVAIMRFGLWGALGVFLGALATPWSPDEPLWFTAISGLLNVLEGLIPWLWFRANRHLHIDLVDFRSLLHFLLFGAVINSAMSALAGNLLLIEPAGTVKGWALFTWWVSDFSAAVLLATPILAFGGPLFDRISGHRPETVPRTLRNAVQVTLAIILIGWSASMVIRNYLEEMIERDRQREQTHRIEIARLLSELDRTLEGASLAPGAQERVRFDREIERIVDALEPQVSGRSALGTTILAQIDQLRRGVHEQQSGATTLRETLELANRLAWEDFSARRNRIHFVSVLMDQMVLLVLVLASLYLLVRVARPLDQIHAQVGKLRAGGTVDAAAVVSPFLEMRNLAEALQTTSEALARKSAALEEQTRAAIAASSAKSEFLAKMSHELRTPLNSIIGFSELIRERGDTLPEEKQTEFLRSITRSGRNLLELIDDLLDIAKIESGKMELLESTIDLRTPIHHAVEVIRPILHQRNQTICIETEDRSLEIRGDAKRLEQVVVNLLSNASKFSPAGAAIVIGAHHTGGEVVLEVRDSGIGIPKDARERVWEEFEQAHDGSAGGTGLGLALVKGIVEMHGGRVSLESEVGRGSTFRIHFPAGGMEGPVPAEGG